MPLRSALALPFALGLGFRRGLSMPGEANDWTGQNKSNCMGRT